MIDTIRGVLRVRKWPKKYGKPRSISQQFWVDWFKQANRAAKYFDGMQQARAIEMTKDSGLYPRDVMLSAMRGRLYWWADETGWKWFPMAAIQDVSDSLDVLAQSIGSVLIRAVDRWRAPDPGSPGDVLTYQGSEAGPEWQPPAGGGGFSAGCLLIKTANQSTASGTLNAITFDAEIYDTSNLHDNTLNPSRITIPEGWTWAVFTASIRWESNMTGFRLLRFDKNGAIFVGAATHRKRAQSESEDSISSPVIPVVEGDYFEVQVMQTSGGNKYILGDSIRTSFSAQKF